MTPDLPPAPTTILARMVAAGISEDRARRHLAAGAVRSGEDVITDPETVVTGRWVIGPSG